MKNALKQLVYTSSITIQKADHKTFYRFIAIFQRQISSTQIIVNSNFHIKIIDQPQQHPISNLKTKDNVLVFGQIVQEGKFFEGKVQKVTIEQALKFQNLMKKIKYKAYLKSNRSFNMFRNQQQNQSKGQILTINKNTAQNNQHF